MVTSKKVLNIFTNGFPYGGSESYLYNEVPVLEEFFEEINVYPIDIQGRQNYKSNKLTSKEVAPSVFKYSFLFFRILFKEGLLSKNKKSFWKNIRKNAAILKRSFTLAQALKKNVVLGKPNEVNYSFWMNEWALALAILKQEGKIKNFVCRVNGYDIYSERRSENYLPFQAFILSKIDKVFTVSNLAADYLKKKYTNVDSNLFETAYFGVQDPGEAKLDSGETLRIVTNSKIIPLKRIHLLAESLQNITIQVHWMHHGSAEKKQEASLSEMIERLPENVTFIHSKFTESYSEALEKIKNFSPHVLINLSTSEGLPVSIIEATAMGVPIIATDVGGTSEVVNETNGILLTDKIDRKGVLAAIHTFYNEKKWFTLESRRLIRKQWEENFSAKNNYSKFAHRLLDILKK